MSRPQAGTRGRHVRAGVALRFRCLHQEFKKMPGSLPRLKQRIWIRIGDVREIDVALLTGT